MNNIKFNTALSNKLQLYTGAGNLLKAHVQIDSTAATGTYYVQVFDAADVPANTTALTATNSLCSVEGVSHTTGAFTDINFDFTNGKTNETSGTEFRNGCTIGMSTTQFTATATGAIMVATAYFEVL